LWFVPPRNFWLDIPFFIVIECIFWFLLYSIQPTPGDADPFENYTVAIQDIENIGNQLANLVGFLKQEREKVEESRATLRLLQSEKSELEPVVVAQRDAVNAILSAYTRTTASRVWKERALGFVSGLAASLLASLVFEYFRR
jgi:hypothetical protein